MNRAVDMYVMVMTNGYLTLNTNVNVESSSAILEVGSWKLEVESHSVFSHLPVISQCVVCSVSLQYRSVCLSITHHKFCCFLASSLAS